MKRRGLIRSSKNSKVEIKEWGKSESGSKNGVRIGTRMGVESVKCRCLSRVPSSLTTIREVTSGLHTKILDLDKVGEKHENRTQSRYEDFAVCHCRDIG